MIDCRIIVHAVPCPLVIKLYGKHSLYRRESESSFVKRQGVEEDRQEAGIYT